MLLYSEVRKGMLTLTPNLKQKFFCKNFPSVKVVKSIGNFLKDCVSRY